MNIIEPSFDIIHIDDPNVIINRLELAGRTCYKSEEKIDTNLSKTFIKSLVKSNHLSVLEHEKATVKFICDRGISHQLVRHRHSSYSQESTRYCNYSKDKFNNEITVILPYGFNRSLLHPTLDNASGIKELTWLSVMMHSEKMYFELLKNKVSPEIARGVLPTSLKTELVMTCNLREWRTILELRSSPKAHPQMRELIIPLLKKFYEILPEIYGDIYDALSHYK